jgi:hypothetical protein
VTNSAGIDDKQQLTVLTQLAAFVPRMLLREVVLAHDNLLTPVCHVPPRAQQLASYSNFMRVFMTRGSFAMASVSNVALMQCCHNIIEGRVFWVVVH